VPGDARDAENVEERLQYLSGRLNIDREAADDGKGVPVEGPEGGFALFVVVVLELADQHIEEGGGAGVRVDVRDQGLAVGRLDCGACIEREQAIDQAA
jgi:hypothetical protein